MIDSTNPRSMADNIRKLWDKFKSISGDLLPSRSTATTGQILKLTGENKTPSWAEEYRYTPPAYSKTEVNTGQKWIDGKDIYRITYSGTTVAKTTDTLFIDTEKTSSDIETIVHMDYVVKQAGLIGVSGYYIGPANRLQIYVNYAANSYKIFYLTGSTYLFGETFVTLYYTKPDPAPETRDDDTPEEVKETKTRKKTTK